MKLLLIVGIFAIFTQTSAFSQYSHVCFTCNTEIGNGKDHCADPISTEGIIIQQCDKISVNSTGCMKGISEFKGAKIYTRGCYFGDVSDKKNCESFITGVQNDKIINCNVCENHYLCNGSNEVTTTMSLGLCLAILLVRNLL